VVLTLTGAGLNMQSLEGVQCSMLEGNTEVCGLKINQTVAAPFIFIFTPIEQREVLKVEIDFK
jgi:hypothetical protein